MPKLAVFPKAWMNALCIDGSMTLKQWIELSSKLNVDGLEFYSGFLDLRDRNKWGEFRSMVEDQGREIPMLCCSPDFCHPEKAFRKKEIEKEKRWIEMCHALGGSYCRVLSGQRRPGINVEEGIKFVVECIEECLVFASSLEVTLVLENHYKDDFWEYPEFAQHSHVFHQLIEQIDSSGFGVNFDPSNALLAGENPLELLDKVKHRVVTMHASDRFLIEGTLQDLRQEEQGSVGYAKRLSHGEIGRGLNDYDEIFRILKGENFNGWISIEDGMDGFDQLQRSVLFLRKKILNIFDVSGELPHLLPNAS